jgi:eukaryotic-like serine/threonine-protein kinase
MTAEKWERIKSIYQEAQELPREERPAFLAAACSGDPELRAEIESLLDESDNASGYLEAPPAAVRALSPVWAGDLQRTAVGPYRIVREIGRGGMGSVYEAVREHADFEQRVALKVIRGGLDSDSILQRFHAERRILARLEHPHIARFLDGGATEAGQPYFAMEFIDGEPITQYAADRELPIRTRLGLFLEVCSAVAYAHQNLVIHRDLKPSNILVTRTGVVKLLDFGIATVLSSGETGQAATVTALAERPMTPEYASPEQVCGSPVTTATDVYSLGVVLYELLVGRPPYQIGSRARSDWERIVREETPVRPSVAAATTRAVNRNLSGDLDNIVMMAMRKEPGLRYRSVEQFSEDLRRFLDGRPVIARPHTVAYRLSRFVGRHRGVATAACLIVLSLSAGLIAADRQARRAERRFQQVRNVANTFLFEFHDAIARLPGSTPARRMIVDKGLEYLESLAPEAEGDETLLLELGRAYRLVGEAQGAPRMPNLGDTKGAAESFENSYRMLTPLAQRGGLQGRASAELAMVRIRTGDLAVHSGNTTAARMAYSEALSHAERAVSLQGSAPEALKPLAGVLYKLGDLERTLQSFPEAEKYYRRAAATADRILQVAPGDKQASQYRLSVPFALGDTLYLAARYEQAVASFDTAVRAVEISRSAQTPNAPAERVRALALMRKAEALEKQGNDGRAEAAYLQAVSAFDALHGADPANSQARYDLQIALAQLGSIQYRLQRVRDARASYVRAIALARQQAERHGATALDWNSYAAILSEAHPPDLQDPAIAVRFAKRAVEATGGRDHFMLDTLARALFSAKDVAGAASALVQAMTALPAENAGSASTLRTEYEQRLRHYRQAARQPNRTLRDRH